MNASKSILSFCCLASLLCSCAQSNDGNGKKVYADYHGVRYTREHDAKLGRWEMYADTRNSSTGRKSLCYNADLIDSLGRHDIASTAYPLAGMQSNLDEDFLEYQILQAKTALIDGFFIEWGFFPHENDVLLKAMQKVAAKYDFEVGVNWCDGWLYYDWITKVYPEINSRSAKTDYMVGCYQYLIDSVFNVATAPIVNGHPVFYHFGPGASTEEFSRVKSSVTLPQGMKEPVGLRRWADWGYLEDGKYVPVRESDDMNLWVESGEIPTPWIPARVRPMDADHLQWDHYAEPEDLIAFMEPFRDSVWMSDRASYIVKSAFVMPGMDNRGCAGWGRGHFYLIPRNEGRTYRDMWDFCMDSADSLDMVFIASWSDYTEGHEIEPTEENGYRELCTTLEYASKFKGLGNADDSGIDLPLRLFDARKSCSFLGACGADVSNLQSHLDAVAHNIASARYGRAVKALKKCESSLSTMRDRIDTTSFEYVDCGRSVALSADELAVLEDNFFNCRLEFEYLDEGQEFLFVRSSKSAKDGSEVLGKLRADGSGVWKEARMEMSKSRFNLAADKPLLNFGGDVRVRNVRVVFDVYKLK